MDSEEERRRSDAARLVFALDIADEAGAKKLVKELAPLGIRFKVGLEALLAGGAEFLSRILPEGAEIILDVKYGGDIQITNEKALAAVCLGRSYVVRYVTVHDCVRPVVDALKKIGSSAGVLRVTVLTDQDPSIFGGQHVLSERVCEIAYNAMKEGAAGVVCSPREARVVRRVVGRTAIIMTPGVRPAWAIVQNDDQARTATVAEAIGPGGASLVVIGRPIAKAADPAVAATRIIDEIAIGISQRPIGWDPIMVTTMPGGGRVPTNDEAMHLFRASGADLTGHFVLKSGAHSDRFINGPQAFSHPHVAAAVATRMIIDGLPADQSSAIFVGVADEGNQVAHALADAAQRLFPTRKFRAITTKKNGDTFVIGRGLGEDLRDQPVIVVEGTMTTGKSAAHGVLMARDLYSATVIGVMCVSRRGERATAEIVGVPWIHAFNEVRLTEYSFEECRLHHLCRDGVPINLAPGYGEAFVAKKGGQPPYEE